MLKKKLIRNFCLLFLLLLLFFPIKFILLYLTSDSPVFSQKIETRVLNNIDFKSNDSIILKSKNLSSDIVYTFYQIKKDETVPFLEFKIVNGIESEPSYKIINNSLYIWLGDTFYNVNNGSVTSDLKIEDRNKMDTRLYQYDLENNELKEIKLVDRRKTIILDILENDTGDLYILNERATDFEFPNKWKNCEAYINNELLSNTITGMTSFRSNGLWVDNQLLIPTYDGIIYYDLNNKNINKEKYRYNLITNVVCTLFGDDIYIFYLTDTGIYIEKLDKNLNPFSTSFIENVNSLVVGIDKFYFYGSSSVENSEINVVEFSVKSMSKENTYKVKIDIEDIDYLKSYYNNYTQQIEFYSIKE